MKKITKKQKKMIQLQGLKYMADELMIQLDNINKTAVSLAKSLASKNGDNQFENIQDWIMEPDITCSAEEIMNSVDDESKSLYLYH